MDSRKLGKRGMKLTTIQAAKELGLSVSHTYAMIGAGTLPAERVVVGGHTFLQIDRADVERLKLRPAFRKVTAEMAKDMRESRERGESLLQIAGRHDVDISTVSRTCSGKIHAK